MKRKVMVLITAIVVGCAYITSCTANTTTVGMTEATSEAATTAETTTEITAETTSAQSMTQEASGTEEEGLATALTTFSTTDLDGNAVDQSIWADYELTMVNIWATWCGPCVGEMPELAMVYNSIDQKTNMVSICIDGSDDPDTAKSMLSDSDAGFTTLVMSATLNSQLLIYISAIPTTIFVDSDGHMVGDPIIGVRSAEEYKQEMEDRLLLKE